MIFRKSRIMSLFTISVLLLNVLSLVYNQTITSGELSEYQQVINSLYELNDNRLWSETAYERLNSQYGQIDMPKTQTLPQIEEINNLKVRIQQSIASESFSQLVVTFDISHAPTFGHDQVFMLADSLAFEGATFNIMEGFDIPGDTNVLLIPSSTAAYSDDELFMIGEWFYSEGPHLIWIAGDSDWSYSPESNNGILEWLGTSLRLSADTVDDLVYNDGASYRVAVQTPLQDGALNAIFTEGVGSAIFHGPTSVLGYQDGVVDLSETWLEGVEVIMQSSEDSTAIDQDETFSEFDYYSMNKPYSGSYPMIAVQDMSESKYVIASGEVIYSDFKSQYSYQTEVGEWNGGFHEGKQLVDNILSWFGYVIESEVPQPESQLRVAFDVSHAPTVHYDAYMLEEALTSINVEFRWLWDIYELSEDIDVLLVPSSTSIYDEFELDHISTWFGTEGKKLLWVAGDSDFGGYYPTEPNNAILERIDARLRISADGVQDFVNNDAAAYRVAVQTPVSDGEYNSIFTDGVSSAIFHGPASVLGFQDGVVDLTDTPPEGVEIVMQASEDAQAIDQDNSFSEFDYYSFNKPFDGSYPMMAIDSHFGNDKYVIASGEPIFSDYKQMYNLFTEQGLWGNPDAWNGGIHDGKILVDNVFNWFDLDPALPRYHGQWPIYIEGDEEFANYEFPGSGAVDDPYRIEGFSFMPVPDVNSLITILDTTAYFQITDNYLNSFWSMEKAIYLQNVGNGIIANNVIRNNNFGIDVTNIYDCTIANNEIYDNGHDAIRMGYSERITIDSNIIYNTGASGLSINTATDINVMNNIFYNNQFGMHTYLFDYSFISGNSFYGNFEEGMHLWECMNNEISNNMFYYQGFANIGLYYSESNSISDNIVSGSGFGVLLETSQNNYISNNEIFETDIGIFLNNRAGNNRLLENILYGNNQGIFISNNPFSVIELWPNQEIFVTDSDSVNWHFIWFEIYSEFPINEVHDGLLQVRLTIDGIPVDTSFSEVYFDGEQWCFDVTFLSDPLSIGEHEFVAQFVFEGEILGEPISHVTVIPTPSVGNFIILNTLFDNNNGILLQNANDNIVAGNTLTNNFGEGIGVYGSSNNRIVWNQIEFSGMKGIMVSHDFGWDITSEFNTIANNTIFGGNEDGISLEWVKDNLVAENEIFGNQWAGVRLFGTSSYNDIFDNSIHGNWGGGIAFESYSDVQMRFWWDITATKADSISWQISFYNESEDQAWYEHDTMEVLLTVDGEPVNVWYSEVYWDDGLQAYRFDVDYYSEPLSEGEHEFTVQCTLEGEILLVHTAYVTVVPATDENYISHNTISGNEIFENGWNGINLQRSHSNSITQNQIYYNPGEGLYVQGSNNIIEYNIVFGNSGGLNLDSANNNLIANNEFFENGWNGIQLSGTSSENTIVENVIRNNWGSGINIESHTTVNMRYWQDITATDNDHISWQVSVFDPDFDEIQFWYDFLVTELTIDGESIGVWYSWIYYDFESQQWRFDIDYYSDPLPVGEHEFTTQFFLDEVLLEEETRTAIVTVLLATDDDYASHNYIANNEIYSNEWAGINVWRSHYNFITQNQITDNFGCGIEILGSYNTISENSVSGNGFEGIRLSGDDSRDIHPEFNTIERNVISGNGQTGINLASANDNLLAYNEIYGHPGVGIGLGGTASNNILLENVIYNNWGAGISLDFYSEVRMRFWQDITATDADYISWQASSNYESFETAQAEYELMEVALTVDGEPVEVWFSGIYFDEGNLQYRFDIDYYSEPLDVGEHEFHVEFFLDSVPQEEWTRTAIVIVVPATADDYSSHNSIIGNHIYDIQGNGINIWRSRLNYLEDNIISNCMTGIFLDSSILNTIKDNIAFENTNSGIELHWASDYNLVTRNSAFDNGMGGIFTHESNFNEIERNSIHGNNWDGIAMFMSISNRISRNYIQESVIGIFLFYSDFTTISRNILVGNDEAGILLMDSSENLISKNILIDNTNTGIGLLSSSHGNSVSRNIITGSYFGILLDSSGFNHIYRNKVYKCEFGITLESSTENKVSRNFVSRNEEGILLSHSSSNRISRNTVFKNGIGIHLFESSDNTLFRNKVFRNDENVLEEP